MRYSDSVTCYKFGDLWFFQGRGAVILRIAVVSLYTRGAGHVTASLTHLSH